MLHRRHALLALGGMFLAATPGIAQDKSAAAKLSVVASFSILGDLIANVGGDRIALHVLVGPDSDAHVFAPTPADAKTLAAAKVVFVNGLGFEGWMTRLVKASGSKAPVVVATTGVAPRKMDAEEHHGHDHAEETDPHAWQSVANAKIYITNIRDGLIAADPAGKDTYEENARAYLAKLDAMEQDVRNAVARIAPERRRIITTHDAFGYFGAAYGVEFIAPQGVSTESEASAKDVARIVRQIKKQKVPAVFLENVTDPRLVKRIADETGAKIGGTLYSDALTAASGDAPTYLDMMRHNIRTLSAALMS
jgi:zinc/manganese transport system substrate-binding protein